MKNLKQWLQRLVTPPKPATTTTGRTGIDVEKTINDALTAAGLLPRQADTEATKTGVATPVIELPPQQFTPAPQLTPIALPRVRMPEAAPALVPTPVPPSPAPLRKPFLGSSEERYAFTCDAGTRSYVAHLPWPAGAPAREGLPIVVMLHGCTQSVADFATGTQMNAWADREGFIVVYPEQTAGANPSRCWNWFRKTDQRRDKGEPSIIAGIAQEACTRYHADPARIFIAGLSAGGAMAVVVGDAYPEIFAAVASHSGLRLGAAHDVPSAFTAMKSGAMGTATAQATRVTPTLVLHGDADKTVSPRNGDSIIADVVASAAERTVPLEEESTTVFLPGRKQAQRSVHRDGNGKVIAEYWRVQGGAHAWFGGDARGSYTDPNAPDASEAIVKFFGLQGVNIR